MQPVRIGQVALEAVIAGSHVAPQVEYLAAAVGEKPREPEQHRVIYDLHTVEPIGVELARFGLVESGGQRCRSPGARLLEVGEYASISIAGQHVARKQVTVEPPGQQAHARQFRRVERHLTQASGQTSGHRHRSPSLAVCHANIARDDSTPTPASTRQAGAHRSDRALSTPRHGRPERKTGTPWRFRSLDGEQLTTRRSTDSRKVESATAPVAGCPAGGLFAVSCALGVDAPRRPPANRLPASRGSKTWRARPIFSTSTKSSACNPVAAWMSSSTPTGGVSPCCIPTVATTTRTTSLPRSDCSGLPRCTAWRWSSTANMAAC